MKVFLKTAAVMVELVEEGVALGVDGSWDVGTCRGEVVFRRVPPEIVDAVDDFVQVLTGFIKRAIGLCPVSAYWAVDGDKGFLVGGG